MHPDIRSEGLKVWRPLFAKRVALFVQPLCPPARAATLFCIGQCHGKDTESYDGVK